MKVMILGAGRGQMPLYEICKSLDCEVVFVTPEGDYPGIGKAKVRYANVMDYETVYQIAKEEKADAIISDQLDAGIYSCAYASEKLGLKGIGSEVAKRFTDKYTMRKFAQKAGVAVPEYFAVHSVEDVIKNKKNIKFPIVMKPSDNASSRGIYLVESLEELLSHFEETKEYSSEGLVLLEQYIIGTEYVVETYTKDYNTTSLIVGHRDYFDIPKKFIPKATVFRDAELADTHIEQKVLEASRKLVKTYELPFGITHGEFIYNHEEDEVYLVEIAARGGGEFISADLIPLACGVHANELLVKHVLGIPYEVPSKRTHKASAYYSYLLPEGKITVLEGIEDVKNISGVYNPMFDNVELGMDIPPIKDKASRKGPLLVCGETKEECYKVRDEMKKTLNIVVTSNTGEERTIIW